MSKPLYNLHLPEKQRQRAMRAWAGEHPHPDAHLAPRHRALLFATEMVALVLFLGFLLAAWMLKPWVIEHVGHPFTLFLTSLHFVGHFPFIASVR